MVGQILYTCHPVRESSSKTNQQRNDELLHVSSPEEPKIGRRHILRAGVRAILILHKPMTEETPAMECALADVESVEQIRYLARQSSREEPLADEGHSTRESRLYH
jgi:hypothetical protein